MGGSVARTGSRFLRRSLECWAKPEAACHYRLVPGMEVVLYEAGRPVITESLARGLRRYEDAGLQERIKRLLDDDVLGNSGRFGAIVRRRHEYLVRTFGESRVHRPENCKRFVSWAIAFPESPDRDRLVVSYFQRRNSGIERECQPTAFTCTAHCRERMIQIAHPEPIPLALLLWTIGDTCATAYWGAQEGRLLAAFSFGLLIGVSDKRCGVEMRTVIAADALGPGKRTLWEALLKRRPPLEIRANIAGDDEADQ